MSENLIIFVFLRRLKQTRNFIFKNQLKQINLNVNFSIRTFQNSFQILCLAGTQRSIEQEQEMWFGLEKINNILNGKP